jgi:hypothetical protein
MRWPAGWLLGLALVALPAAAAEPGEPVDLDKLLKLPDSFDSRIETRAGSTPGEWRARFQEIRDALEAERAALEDAEAQLEEKASASSAWQIAPPIPGAAAAAGEAPVDFQLRQVIRRHRENIEILERRLQQLEIEANLAGVPETWRGDVP